MRYPIIFLLIGGLTVSVFPQEIFRTNLEGVAVQNFTASQPIDGFSVEGPDEEGYVYLVAHSGCESGKIVRNRWQGTGFQPLSMSEGEYLTGFDVRGPDENGYVYLNALGSEGTSGDILRSLWSRISFCPLPESLLEGITSLKVSGPDEEGCVYLSAGNSVIDPDASNQTRIEYPEFALGEIPNPVTGVIRISYSLAESCRTNIVVYDPSGRLVVTLVDGEIPTGNHSLTWNGINESGQLVNSGVYFVKMNAVDKATGGFTATRKLVLVK
ncbi:T9SS type A sorting domain-containing protein [candidate division WOR-3 bacterium]|nr:T9SS type A sorting domain-containing protein [candidate division WOR-3 bacterium]